MNSTHTLGPWNSRNGRDPHNQGQVSCEATGATVAISYNDEGGHNARLIAAAPELLEALKMARQHIGVGYSAYQRHAIITEVDAAIAKAEGKP